MRLERMVYSAAETKSGYPVFEVDVPELGQNWSPELLKCAHCKGKFIIAVPENATPVDCPYCGNITRIWKAQG